MLGLHPASRKRHTPGYIGCSRAKNQSLTWHYKLWVQKKPFRVAPFRGQAERLYLASANYSALCLPSILAMRSE